MKIFQLGFTIIAVYVGNLNIIRTPREIEQAAQYLAKEFEIKDLRKTNFALVYKWNNWKIKYLFFNQTILKEY